MAIKISKIHARVRKTILNRLNPTRSQEVRAVLDDGKVTENVVNKRILYMSRDAAERHKFNHDDVLISISDCGVDAPDLSSQPLDMLVLAFNDSVTSYDVNELGWKRMDNDDGLKIVEFVLKHENSPNIVVHCNVGESRSKGVALAISKITERIAFHVSDRGRITQHQEKEYDFFNRRVYEMILMEHMRRDIVTN